MKEYKLNSQLYLFILHECLLDIITLKKWKLFRTKILATNPSSIFLSSVLRPHSWKTVRGGGTQKAVQSSLSSQPFHVVFLLNFNNSNCLLLDQELNWRGLKILFLSQVCTSTYDFSFTFIVFVLHWIPH